MTNKQDSQSSLPEVVTAYLDEIVRRMGYRKKVRQEVREELEGHFVDALKDIDEEERRIYAAKKLIEQFGEAKVLAKLIRRGKKRCRPWWRKAIIRTFQATGILLLLAVLKIGYLAWGQPTIKIDYVEWLNKVVSQERPEELNAREDYERAIALAEEVPLPEELDESFYLEWPGDATPKEQEELRCFLSANQDVLEALREGNAKPFYWFDYEGGILPSIITTERPKDIEQYFQQDLIRQVLQPLSKYRDLAKRMALSGMWHGYQGNLEKATSEGVGIVRFGMHLEGRRLLAEVLCGMAIEALGKSVINEILFHKELSPDLLWSLQKELAQLYSSQQEIMDFEAEKVFLYDLVQRSFTDDGQGDGRMLIKGLPLATKDVEGLLSGFITGYSSRREVMAEIEREFCAFELLLQETPYQQRMKKISATEPLLKAWVNNLLLQMLTKSMGMTTKISWRIQAEREALLTVLALCRWELAKGAYPEELEELVVGGYLKELPNDPYGAGLLRYEKRGADFVLYSVGADFEDDGGVQNPKDIWSQKDIGGGDRVFWPVQE